MEMVEAEIWTITQTDKGNAVMLRSLESDLVVPIFIGQFEVQSILIGSGDMNLTRPLSHDLFLSLLDYTGLSLRRIEVYVRNASFHTRIVIYGGQFSEKRPLVLNARPSDAFALAVRQKCPIYVSRRTLKTTGLPADFILLGMEENDETPLSAFSDIQTAPPPRTGKYQDLREALRRAVDSEEYERAAEIRDQLILLEQEDEPPRHKR
jgi:bifunctional DNase/RNase